MSTKQPLYTALGWITWTVGKRVVKRKVMGEKPKRRGLKVAVALLAIGGAGAGAYAATNGSSTDA